MAGNMDDMLLGSGSDNDLNSSGDEAEVESGQLVPAAASVVAKVDAVASSAPSSATPLNTMIKKEQQKQRQRSSLHSHHHHHRGGGGTSTSVHVSANIIPQQQQQRQQQQQALETEAKKREEFLMFTRVLMAVLERKDKDKHSKAKAAIKLCAERNKAGDPQYSSLTASIQQHLRHVVGDAYWKKAEDCLKRVLQSKQLQGQHQHSSSSSSSSNKDGHAVQLAASHGGQQSQSSSSSKSAGSGGTGVASPIAAIPASTTGPPGPPAPPPPATTDYSAIATADYSAIATAKKAELLEQASNVEAETTSEAVSGAHSPKSRSRTTLPGPDHRSRKKMKITSKKTNKTSGAAHDHTVPSDLVYLDRKMRRAFQEEMRNKDENGELFAFADGRDKVPLCHFKLAARRTGSANCAIDALNAACGQADSFRKREIPGVECGDYISNEQYHNALNKKGYYTKKVLKHVQGLDRWKALLKLSKGIYLVRAKVINRDPNGKYLGHLLVVNAWGKFVMDNNKNPEKRYISYATVDLKRTDVTVAFFKALGVTEICQVDLIKVHKDKLPECHLGRILLPQNKKAKYENVEEASAHPSIRISGR